MKEYYLQLLDLLKKDGVVKNWKVITYNGKIPSYNKIYASPNWRVRYQMSEKYHKIFQILLLSVLGKPKAKLLPFSIFIAYNSKHDPDNIVGIEKFFADTLVSAGYVAGDTKKYYKSLTIVPDTTLKNNTVEFYFVTHND